MLPALLAGALVAFLQAMTLFGSPAILALPAGFHTMTTKIWSLFQYPPKPELAAAASLPLLVLTVLLLRAEHMILGRRGYSVVGGKYGAPRLDPAAALALAGARAVPRRADAAGVPALWRAAQRRLLAGRHALRDRSRISRCTTSSSCCSSCRRPSSRSRTPFILGAAAATVGTVIWRW